MATVCNGCKTIIENLSFMRCSLCDESYDLFCLNMTESQFNTLSQNCKSNWLCPSCTSSQPKTDNTATPIRNSSRLTDSYPNSQNITTTRGSKQKGKSVVNTSVISDLDGSSILSEIRQLRVDISEFKQEMKDQNKSLSKSLDDKLADFSKAFAAKDVEIASLKSTIAQLENTIAEQEQRFIKNELEIIGMPEDDNENLNHLTRLTAKKIGVDLNDGDIDEIVRVGPKPSKNAATSSPALVKPRPIVVRLVRRQKRDELISAARIRRSLTSETISSKPSQKIYINERLTKSKRILFRDARIQALHNGFRYCWVRSGGIYIRKGDKAPIIPIKSRADLEDRLRSPDVPVPATTEAP